MASCLNESDEESAYSDLTWMPSQDGEDSNKEEDCGDIDLVYRSQKVG
jgi:hypothetical protein